MKILQVNKYFLPHLGGIETVVGNIQQVLDRENVEADVLCFAEDRHDAVETSRSGFSGAVHTIYRQGRAGVAFGMPLSWSFLSKFRDIADQYDLIVLHHPFPFGFFGYWLYARHKPAVVWYHSDIVRQKFLGFLIRPLLKKVLATARQIVVSHSAIASNSDLLKNFAKKIMIVPFWAALPPSSTDRPVHRICQLLSVGRLVYYKGYEYLIRAMAGIPAELTIVGQGPLREHLEGLIAKLGLTNVRIIQPVGDLDSLYASCDVFVLPSVEISEAFGLVQLEAMAHGKPVINTHLPTAVPAVSLHGQTGLTVEPKNAAALREAIATLVYNPDLRSKYGAQARHRARQEYSYDQFRNNLKTLIELSTKSHE